MIIAIRLAETVDGKERFQVTVEKPVPT